MAYKSKVNYSKRKSYKSRFSKRVKKARARRGRKSWSKSALKKDNLKAKVRKVLGIFAGIFFILIFIGTVFSLSVVAKYSSELPNPDEPFEKGQYLTSYLHDRNGKELYKIHGDENRDIAQIEEIPLEVQWAFLAAEDVDFYTHKGVDIGGLIKASLYECCKIGSRRGGSTITQQMIKNTVLTSERTYERKIKEIILSLRIEQKYDKHEVLQLYMNEIGFGGNTYGIKTAARVYFGKDAQELSIAEAALLAGLPRAPGLYSPLFASDVKQARELAIIRQEYVLDQMLEKRDQINKYAREYNDWDGEEDFLTEEMLEEAKKEKIAYQSGDVHIEAPHFVFYVEDELQKGNYNNGKPFTLSEIERGGLKITTSLDLDLQHIAEDSLKAGVESIGKEYGGNNGALVTIDPKSGQVLAMVGSSDYFGKESPEGCTLGGDCKFEPKVNVSVALRQPGSSLKPIVYYTGFESGKLYPASILPDIPITFTNGYKPKNNDGAFFNQPWTLRRMLQLSRNIPAVEAIEIIGVTDFLNSLEKFGYTTYVNPEMYGPAIALGAGDVKLVEHVNGFSVLATQGIYHQISPILKIEDKDGEVLYDYYEDETREGVRVADERACYLVNDIIRNYHVTPPPGYVFGGKTGTSDENKNVYYMGYSPEFVTGVWVGNNDNSRMSHAAYGYTVARPIWIDYTMKIIGRFAPTPFTRPGGIVSASVCSDSGLLATEHCQAISDLFIQDKLPPGDDSHKIYRVCSDQEDSLARPIDEELGFAVDKIYRYIVAPKPEWQSFWDNAWGQGSPPTESCTINRSPSGSDIPWVIIDQPSADTAVSQGGSLNVEATAYSSNSEITRIEVYIGDTYITQATNNPFVSSITIPSSISSGYYDLRVIAYDAKGEKGSKSVSILVGNLISLMNPSNSEDVIVGIPLSIDAQHVGASSVDSAEVIIDGPTPEQETMTEGSGDVYSHTWAPIDEGEYSIQVVLHLSDGTEAYSNTISVTALMGEIIEDED